MGRGRPSRLADRRVVGVTDGREPRICPDCLTLCSYDGWDHVHPDGLGIGSCERGQIRTLTAEVRRLQSASEATTENIRCPWTDRELDVVWSSADGLSVKEIAEQMRISPHTVKTHLRGAAKKINYEGSRAGLVGIAFREGWIT
jgi:DNA-binding CsgD family transcriptional regulator